MRTPGLHVSRYWKAIVALLGGISAWGITAASDGAITAAEAFGLLGTLSVALGVYVVPNSPTVDGP